MNIWEWLGIPQTTDIAKIKSAYARQAKLYHPEEHPEEFKALQKAYKAAIQMAKSRNPQTFDMTSGQSVDIPEQKPEQRPEQSPEQRQKQNPEQGLEQSPKQSPEQSSEQEPAKDMDRKEAGPTDHGVYREVQEERAEYSFDYSDVDSYGDKERFFKQFSLLARNPYLRNNRYTWEYFLHLDIYSRLFKNTDFRMQFVRAVCAVSGWRRKTILYLETFLLTFHTAQNALDDGSRETELWKFRLKKLPHLRLPAFFMDRFWEKEGRDFHRQIHTKLSKEMGRELDLEMKSDVIRYMKQYLIDAESKEDFVEHLHRRWNVQQIKWAAAGFMIFLALVLLNRYSAQKRYQEAEDLMRADYIMRLYGLEAETYTEEEQLMLLKEYDWDWENAERAIDNMLERYENW